MQQCTALFCVKRTAGRFLDFVQRITVSQLYLRRTNTGFLMKRILTCLSVMLLAGCVAPSSEPPFTGPVAKLEMTDIPRFGGYAVFYVSKINGQDFYGEYTPSAPGPDEAIRLPSESDLTITIPAGVPTIFSLVAYTIYQAPILALTLPVHNLKGDTSFTPVANQTYVLKGSFSRDYSAEWIEDAQTGIVEGNKVTMNGSARVSFLNKFFTCGANGCAQ